MDFEEWHYENRVKPKQDWQRVTAQAKEKKLLNKKSKRDIERESRIAEMGGTSIEVTYGIPLSLEERSLRMELEWDLKYPYRKDKKTRGVLAKKYSRSVGSDRSSEELLNSLITSAKTRAKKQGLPFDLSPGDLKLPDLCPVLGIELSWGSVISNNTPSVDRIIPELGYTKDNCKIISHKANRLKNNASEDELKAILEYITRERLDSR